MARIPHPCVTISACLAGALLLLPLCWGDNNDFDYDSTHSPDYFDNSTIEYSFFSNGSTEDLEHFLMGGGTDADTSDPEKDERVPEEKPTETTITVMSQASRWTPVYLHFPLVMMVFPLLRLL